MRPHDLNRMQLLIRFGYDGSRFRGLQPQGPQIPTAGQALKERLCVAAGSPPKALNFAARTDAGVHAISNLATCYWRDLDEDGIARVMERVAAPRADGLTHVRAWRVPPDTHARGSARGKRYRYIVEDRAEDLTHLELNAPCVWVVAPALDVERMRRAGACFVGTHDFSALRAGGCSASSAVKTLTSVRVDGPFTVPESVRRRFVIEVAGTAFLRKMMRHLVGMIVEVGAGLREPEDVAAFLRARMRDSHGLCAPPGGLTLMEVGCAWPPDGSALIPELAGLAPDADVGG